MKSNYKIFSIIAVLFMFAILASGCSTTNTDSTTTTDGTGTVTSSTTDISSTEVVITAADVSTISSIVDVASTVWDLISIILKESKSAKNWASDTASNKAFDIQTLTEDSVNRKAEVICILCFHECKKLPNPKDVLEYVKLGSMPSELALIKFAKTGTLSE